MGCWFLEFRRRLRGWGCRDNEKEGLDELCCQSDLRIHNTKTKRAIASFRTVVEIPNRKGPVATRKDIDAQTFRRQRSNIQNQKHRHAKQKQTWRQFESVEFVLRLFTTTLSTGCLYVKTVKGNQVGLFEVFRYPNMWEDSRLLPAAELRLVKLYAELGRLAAGAEHTGIASSKLSTA